MRNCLCKSTNIRQNVIVEIQFIEITDHYSRAKISTNKYKMFMIKTIFYLLFENLNS